MCSRTNVDHGPDNSDKAEVWSFYGHHSCTLQGDTSQEHSEQPWQAKLHCQPASSFCHNGEEN
jgi:hypothetical protein